MAPIRTKRVEVQFSDAEFAIIARAADAAGLTVAAYLRTVALATKGTRVPFGMDVPTTGDGNSATGRGRQ